MKRNYQTDTSYSINDQDLIRQIAFHEAGHAAAIYLYNQQKQLPPVYFQIIIKAQNRPIGIPLNTCSLAHDHFAAEVEGGRLIQPPPITAHEGTQCFSDLEYAAYQTAFEADMINLLVGPLAEAKHVALRDDELFNAQLVDINALHNYGGTSDLNQVYDYLNILIAPRSQHKEKMAELFDKAFQFISSPTHWKAIERLANYILTNQKNIISCEEAIAVLEDESRLKEAVRFMADDHLYKVFPSIQ
ncbi:MAG: hypothetical protein U1D70_09825 [Methylobacter sp.]|nr:hypothetical protein [Methylobacter sp.]MDP2429401.1 hypothetical protein [Methylobacter sp.]MDP3054570.1 hypothetical protein [Methylobacter sp.]MDP3363612.1 hypothetical protein [Methylobacter sp.]MDZ4219302.1 hypothetical protein [Methylobacter sp.]